MNHEPESNPIITMEDDGTRQVIHPLRIPDVRLVTTVRLQERMQVLVLPITWLEQLQERNRSLNVEFDLPTIYS